MNPRVKKIALATPGVDVLYKKIGSVRQSRRISRKVKLRKQNALQAAAAISETSSEPVFIYQMSKVGSSTVYRSLKQLEIANPIFHIHYLNPTKLRELEQRIATSLSMGRVPNHVWVGQALADEIRKRGALQAYKIITLVRDPIARIVSGTFQVPEFVDPSLRRQDGTFDVQKCADILNGSLLVDNASHYPVQWFDTELKAVFGVDVFEHSFDLECGYSIIHENNVQVLVLRMEDLSEVMGRALAEFLELDREVPIVNSNVRTDSADSEAYAELKRKIHVSRETCQQIYGGRFARHFYPPRMIEAFIDKWTSQADSYTRV